MAETGPGRQPNRLTDNKATTLEGFVGHFADDSNRTIQHLAYYDLVSANLREPFKKFELPMATPEEYYPVLAELSIATECVKGLTEQSLTLKQANEAIQDAFARIAPPSSIPSVA